MVSFGLHGSGMHDAAAGSGTHAMLLPIQARTGSDNFSLCSMPTAVVLRSENAV
ncbi:hypothetical protein RQN30_08285 [Arcanobacterium hippocoleae]